MTTVTRTPLTLRKSEHLGDWYVIERRNGGDVSDACVEGTAAEMLAIAATIAARGYFGARRCAVEFSDGAFTFWSPRNSTGGGNDAIHPDDADDLAREIRAALTPETTPR